MASDIRTHLVDAVEQIMGSRTARPLALAMTKAGLRGLGVNVGHSFDRSGELWLCRRVFARRQGALCIDVGANYGQYARMARRCGAGRVVSFEPVPKSYARLAAVQAEDPRITAYPYAVGEADGEISFPAPVDDRDHELASRGIDTNLLANDAVEWTPVRLTSLDSVLADEPETAALLKIDVEGYELEVFLGARKLLSDKPPAVIQFEFSAYNLRRRQHLGDFAELLPGYQLFRPASRSLVPLDLDHHLANVYTFQNIVAVHKAQTDVRADLMAV